MNTLRLTTREARLVKRLIQGLADDPRPRSPTTYRLLPLPTLRGRTLTLRHYETSYDLLLSIESEEGSTFLRRLWERFLVAAFRTHKTKRARFLAPNFLSPNAPGRPSALAQVNSCVSLQP
jgi:hypothetical protein